MVNVLPVVSKCVRIAAWLIRAVYTGALHFPHGAWDFILLLSGVFELLVTVNLEDVLKIITV